MEKIKTELDTFIKNFKTNIKREYKEDNFFSKVGGKDYVANFLDSENMWEVKLYEPQKITGKINVDLVDINNKIFKYYKHILETYKYSTEERKEFNEEIKFIFILLSNIYDLTLNFLELYFKGDWLNLHLKLIDACLDINNPPSPGLGTSGKEKVDGLWPFLLFFSLCLTQDKDYSTRLLLVLKSPDLFYKIVIIADCVCYFCCCGHGYHFNDNYNNSGIKSVLIVYETYKYLEDNKITMDAASKYKIQILEYLFKYIGKNPSIVLLYKMGKMLNSDEIFNHLLNKTNLLKDAFEKESDACFEHAIDGFEAFVNLCKNPEYLFQILHIITPPEKGVKNRVFREILKTLSSIINNNNQVEYLETKLYKNIMFQKIIDTLKLDVYLGDFEGIWQILLDSTNSNIVTIFYQNKNKYDFGEILTNQVNNLIQNNLTSYRLNAVVRIMNYLLKLGEEIKKKYGGANYYVEQFRDSYKKIQGLNQIEDEDINEFKKYYETNS